MSRTAKYVLAACAFCETRANTSVPCTRAVVAPVQDKSGQPNTSFALTPESQLLRKTSYHVHCAAQLMPAVHGGAR